MSRTVGEALDDFIDHYVKSQSPLLTPWQDDWRSPCEYGDVIVSTGTETSIKWRPVRRDAPDVFAPLEAALDTSIHPDLKLYWGRYFAASFAAQAPQGPLSLLQLWNHKTSHDSLKTRSAMWLPSVMPRHRFRCFSPVRKTVATTC